MFSISILRFGYRLQLDISVFGQSSGNDVMYFINAKGQKLTENNEMKRNSQSD